MSYCRSYNLFMAAFAIAAALLLGACETTTPAATPRPGAETPLGEPQITIAPPTTPLTSTLPVEQQPYPSPYPRP